MTDRTKTTRDAPATVCAVRSSWIVLEDGRVTRLGRRPRSQPRNPRPPTMGRQRLDAAKVRAIRRRAAAGEARNALAAEFGVSHTTIRCVVLRMLWKHLP